MAGEPTLSYDTNTGWGPNWSRRPEITMEMVDKF